MVEGSLHTVRAVSRSVFLTLLIPFFLSACLPLAVGGGTAVGVTAFQERTVGNAVDDTVIWSSIKRLYLEKDVNDLLNNVDVDVTEGRVLLTGTVNKPETRVSAVQLAWQPDGVKEVINEVEVTGKQDLSAYAKDAWITARLKSRLLLLQDIKSINYSLDTVNHVVHIMGIAQSNKELEIVMHEARAVPGVDRVVSHVRIKSDASVPVSPTPSTPSGF
ncbi:MAG: hypothetical protein K0R63_1627 [Rickettsiales bacterium]|jgi:osmotically-inducible protein OsmY|nr:hypothetical protein [Rickettsiales bacterium]